jgi:hypothetical protein
VIARAALEAAIRTEADVVALLPPPAESGRRSQGRPPVRSMV